MPSITPPRPALRWIAAALALACAPAAQAKTFSWDFELSGGSATQTFDSIGALYDYFVTPVAYNADLLGEIRLDTVSIIAPGNALSQGGYFDTEVFFYGNYQAALTAGQRFRQVSGILPQPSAGAKWFFVTRSDSSGAQSFNAQFDFETETGSATPFLHLVKAADRGVIQTDPGDFRAQIRVWTAAAPTNISIQKFDVTVAGTIVRYQIAPFLNQDTMVIEKGDDAYNWREVLNGSTIRILDTLTNRGGGILNNGGSILVSEEQHLTALVNYGRIDNFSGAQIANAGRLVNEAGALLTSAGTIDNNASYPGDLSPEDPSAPPSRNPGFFNRGTVEVNAGGLLNNNASAKFANTGTLTVADGGTFRNEGSFVNGAADSSGGLLSNEGTVRHLGGSFINFTRIDSRGTFRNEAAIDNQGVLAVLYPSGLGSSEFINAGALRNGVNYAVSPANPTRGTIKVESTLRNHGMLDNQSILAVEGELFNNGHLVNGSAQSVGDPNVSILLTGSLTHASGAEFTSYGRLQIAGGAFVNQGTVTNAGELFVNGQGFIGGSTGVFRGGTLHNSGTVVVDEEGEIRDLLLYGQTGAAASTVVNGHLQAERVEILEGTLGGRNRVTANEIVIGANASIGPGNSPGKLTIDGTLFVDGTLELEISPNASDQLEVTGNVIFNEGARVRFVFLDGLVPQTGQRFSFADFVTAPYGILGLGNVGFQLGGLPAGYAGAWHGSGFTVAAVPEPGTYAMVAVGLLMLGVGMRQRLSRPPPRDASDHTRG